MNRSPVQDAEAQETAFLISYKIAPKKESSLLKVTFLCFFSNRLLHFFKKSLF